MNNPSLSISEKQPPNMQENSDRNYFQVILVILILIIFLVGFVFLYKLIFSSDSDNVKINPPVQETPASTSTETETDKTSNSFTVRDEQWVPFTYILTNNSSYEDYSAYKVTGFIPGEREVTIDKNSLRFDLKIGEELVMLAVGHDTNDYKYSSYFPMESVTEIDTLNFGTLKRIENPYSTIFTDSYLTDECSTYSPLDDQIIEPPCGTGLIRSTYVSDGQQELNSGYFIACASTNPAEDEGMDPPGGYTEISKSACDYFVRNVKIEHQQN